MGERDGQAGGQRDAGDQLVAASTGSARTDGSVRLVVKEVVAPVNSAPYLPIES